ncbi:MAG: YbgC/FadM family acyl-CoA thioesterase, partial [Actinomycetia bacterium]|nr:YbgC/FadM family acyl-CoA thioesterase [Actinomycetes bacterium]
MSKMNKKVYYHDTDSGGVVYYANYLKYFEEARTEYLSGQGIDLKELSKEGVIFAVRAVKVNYRAPARYGDTLEISTQLTKVGGASLEFVQEVKVGNRLLVMAQTSLACINRDFMP